MINLVNEVFIQEAIPPYPLLLRNIEGCKQCKNIDSLIQKYCEILVLNTTLFSNLLFILVLGGLVGSRKIAAMLDIV